MLERAAWREGDSEFRKCDTDSSRAGAEEAFAVEQRGVAHEYLQQRANSATKKSLIEGLASGGGRKDAHEEHRGHKKTKSFARQRVRLHRACGSGLQITR